MTHTPLWDFLTKPATPQVHIKLHVTASSPPCPAQHQTRRLMGDRGLTHKPLWFHRTEPGSKDLVKLVEDNSFAWAFNGQYWQHRQRRDWNGCLDLYSLEGWQG